VIALSIISAAKTQGKFDLLDADMLVLLNERHKEMVVQAKALLAVQTIGTTVAGQGTYPLPATVADVGTVYVGTTLYTRVGATDMVEAHAGVLGVTGSVVAPSYDAAGGPGFELYPAPDTTGEAVSAVVALSPPDLTLSDTPVPPDDLHTFLVDGLMSLAYLRNEGRADLSAPHEQRFNRGVELYAARKNSRVGSGPTQMAVAGYHF
jgi:hypothetical protein